MIHLTRKFAGRSLAALVAAVLAFALLPATARNAAAAGEAITLVACNNYGSVGDMITARVRIFHRESAHFVDSRAVQMDFDGSDYVFQAEERIARKVTVTRIAENDDYSLLEGIDPDLLVVLSGKSRLFDGARLRSGEEKEAS